MTTQGPFTWLDRALQKIGDGTLDLDTQAVKAVLLASSQAVSRNFVGASGDARYADLTGELATAGGYTAGGTALTAVTLSRPTASRVKFSSDPFNWTVSSAITFKYVALFAFGATNKDLLMVADMDIGGGSVTANPGALQFSPDALLGWGYWEQP